MRVRVLVLVSAMVLAGCDVSSRTLAPPQIPISAAVTEGSSTPLSLSFLNACTGEIFLVTGMVHVVRTATSDNGGGVHYTIHVNFQSAGGVSQTTGIRYQVISNQAISINNPGGLPFEQTVQLIVKLIGSGPGDNRSFRTSMHVTVDANGSVATSFSDNEVVCR